MYVSLGVANILEWHKQWPQTKYFHGSASVM